jgi:hypothetical protein
MREHSHQPNQLAIKQSVPWLVALILTMASVITAVAQSAAPNAAAPPMVLKKQAGVWVDGPGFDVKYGGTYDTCAASCVSNTKCVMIEYYRPEKKCNQYDTPRKLLLGGSSIVGIR